MPPILELTEATLLRGGARVLDRVSLSIGAGEHTAILGPNGAGKSSLIRMLTLQDRPLHPADAEGAAMPLRIFGRAAWDVEALRRRLGVITGDLEATFGAGTSGGRVPGEDVVLSGLFCAQGVFAHHGVSPPMRDQARTALTRVGAAHLARRPFNELSTGERRRVLIARALVTSPDALVLDEPTAGLDLVARPRFLDAVNELARQGTTVILVTHHVEEIFPEMRTVVLLRGGRVAYAGPPAQALTAARLTDLFGAPVAVESSGGYFHVRMQANDAVAAGRVGR